MAVSVDGVNAIRRVWMGVPEYQLSAKFLPKYQLSVKIGNYQLTLEGIKGGSN